MFTQENGMLGLNGCKARKRTAVRIYEGRHWVSLYVCFRGQYEVRATWNDNSNAGCEICFIASYSLYFEGGFVVWCSCVWIYRSLKWKVCLDLKLQLCFQLEFVEWRQSRRGDSCPLLEWASMMHSSMLFSAAIQLLPSPFGCFLSLNPDSSLLILGLDHLFQMDIQIHC